MLRIIFGVSLWLWVLSPGTARAILIQAYNEDRHDRFENSSEFIGDQFDFSGVGRVSTGGTWATLISPSYFLSSTHLRPGPTTTIRFHETNDMAGAFVDRTIDSGQQIAGSDLWLGKLSSPVDSTIATYPILGPTNVIDLLIYVVGQDGSTGMRVGRNEIDEVLPDFQHDDLGPAQGDVITFDYDTANGVGQDEARTGGGDSGGPSLTVVDGELAVLGIHWFIYDIEEEGVVIERGSGDTLVSSFIPELTTAMVGESIAVVRIPEPTAVWTLGFLVAGVVLSWHFKRQRD